MSVSPPSAPPSRARPAPTTGKRRILAGGITALSGLVVFLALALPNEIFNITPKALVRIPLEAVLGLALVLLLTGKPRRVLVTLAGAMLGVLTVLKIIDLGFQATLARPFHPVYDWVLFDDALSFLIDSVGRAGAVGVVVVVLALVSALPLLFGRAVRRLTRHVLRYRRVAARVTVGLAAAWLTCAVLGTQLVAPVPVASRSALSFPYQKSVQVEQSVRDREVFANQLAVDAFRGTPADQLLTGLRGKDVIFAFVESYGRDAVENPELAPRIGAVLDEGTRRLSSAGFAARSGFLTSPAKGAGSLLAHATFHSGLWIDSVGRLRHLMLSDRLTLSKAFARASWQTVAVRPGNTRPWPEASFYGYQRVHDARNLGYRGPSFSWAPMPDQFALAAFERIEHAPKHPPLMAEIPLVSSHSPWAPLPHLLDWSELGDGSVFDAMARQGAEPESIWPDPARVRTEYGHAIEYSLSSLIRYVETYGDDNTVLVFLGDHQPAPVVTGDSASADVPITIVTRDRAVLDRISSWGWQEGLKPGPDAPVWRMDAFRDRFLSAFGSPGQTSVH